MNVKVSFGHTLLLSNFPGEGPVDLYRVLESIESLHPAFFREWCDEKGSLRPSLPVFVNGEHIRYRKGLSTMLRDGDEIYIIPVISGG